MGSLGRLFLQSTYCLAIAAATAFRHPVRRMMEGEALQ